MAGTIRALYKEVHIIYVLCKAHQSSITSHLIIHATMPSVREYAKALGLPCLNFDVSGPTTLPKGTLGAFLWERVDRISRAGGSFEEVRNVVRELGPRIWCKENAANMLEPKAHKEYPRALKWSRHEDK
jgi:hypothetical protein